MNPINNLKIGDNPTPGNLVAKYAAELLNSKETNSVAFEEASKEIVAQIYDIMITILKIQIKMQMCKNSTGKSIFSHLKKNCFTHGKN